MKSIPISKQIRRHVPRGLGLSLSLVAVIAASYSLAGCGADPEPNTCGNDRPGGVGAGPSNIIGATNGNSDGYAFSCGGEGAPDWGYSWTADVAGEYSFEMQDSDYDTVLGLMDDDCSTELACDDNSAPSGLSRLVFRAEAGQRFVIVADGANGEAGRYVIRVQRVGP